MLRIVDKNERYIIQKVISQVVKKMDGELEVVITETLRYQVVPTDSVGNSHAVEVCETLSAARELVRVNMEAWAA